MHPSPPDFDMPHPSRLPFAVIAVMATLASSCHDTAGPEKPGAPADISISAGNAQTGAAGSALIAPIAAKVSDAKGRAVPNVAVTFQVIGPSGAVDPTSVRTNGAGIATTSWTLPTTAGTAAKVRAVLVDSLTGALVDTVSFSATVIGGAPIAMQWTTLPSIAPTGSTQNISVTLFDPYGNPSPGATVAWTVTIGGGTVTPATSVSDANGVASTSWTLGTAAGTNRMTGKVGTLTGTFQIEGRVAGQPESMSFGPYPAAGPLGGTIPLTVTVYDVFGHPVPGTTVNWSVTAGNGSVAAPSSVTDQNGTTTMSATLGSTAGANTFRAVAGNAAISFSIEGRLLAERLTYMAGPAFGIGRTGAGNFVVSDIQNGLVQTFLQSSPEVKHNIVTGGTPVVVAVDAAGAFAYVSNMDGWLDIIDLGTNTEARQVAVPGAHALALSPGGDRVYVASFNGWVVPVSTTTRQVLDSVAVPNGPWGIAFRTTATDSLMYVTARDGGSITEVDTKTMTVLRTFTVGGRPHGLTISPDGQTLYVADNSGGRVLSVSTSAGTTSNSVSLPGAFGIAISPDGSTLFATTDDGHVAVITASSLAITRNYSTGYQARQIIVSSDGQTAWAADEGGWVDIIPK
jgi:DNA-binding beta-propeller fold protein YncE